MNGFVNALQRFGIGRLAAILGISAGVAAVLFAVVLNFGSKPMSLLYANVDMKEASAITAVLDQSGMKYKLEGGGSTIMVERDKVDQARVMLGAKGLPTSGSVGYEIFDNSSALGQTDFVQQLNHQRGLEGELARTIRSIDGVNFARVQLVLPKRQMFEDETEAPSASVVVGATRQISADQISALQNLVAAAVPGLKPDRVTITDQASGKTLGGGQGESAAGAMAQQRRNETEDSIKRKVKETVDGVVGPGHSRVNVTAELDLSHITTQEEKFDPDGQVAIATTTMSENAKENQPGSNGQVTAQNNLPSTQDGGNATNSASDSGRTEENTNYAISKTVRTEVNEPGAVKKLSVSVAVDWITPLDAKGKAGKPRALTADERNNIENLVKSAVGFDPSRGDVVTVANVQFMRDPTTEGGVAAKSPLSAFDKNDIMRGAELGIMALVALMVIFFVVRPLLKTAGGGGMQPMQMLAGSAGGGNPSLSGGGNMAIDPSTGQQMALPNHNVDDSRIDIARIEGQVKASAVKQVSDFVDRHPEESVSILRSWLHEG
ncbi:flagellar basal-body MS-ring/collar protein FliF [soil metagenome]